MYSIKKVKYWAADGLAFLVANKDMKSPKIQYNLTKKFEKKSDILL